MRILKWLIVTTVCCLAFQTCPVHGCQYNVREVGFIDVGIEPYRLIVYLPPDTPEVETSGLKGAMDVALAETNIGFESVVVGADANQPALEFARAHGLDHYPAAVLVSPDGQSMPLPLPEKEASLTKAVLTALESVLVSPIRQQILEKSADTYGVVLLIEGPASQANTAAREAASTAIGNIGGQLDYLPKPIGKPPVLVALDRKSLAREPVLLWTLGLKPEDVNQPHAAVFYGRGRWVGPLFKGAMLTAENLTQLLAVIGADCECGLDHHWLQGTMLPARWDEGLQQKVAASLGFDPENPMTKMEMISIVRRGMGGFDYPGAPLDYREIQIGGDGAEEDAGQIEIEDAEPATKGAEASLVARPSQVQSSPTSDEPRGMSDERQATSDERQNPSSAIVGQVLAGSLAGIVALVGLASLVIVLRVRKA